MLCMSVVTPDDTVGRSGMQSMPYKTRNGRPAVVRDIMFGGEV